MKTLLLAALFVLAAPAALAQRADGKPDARAAAADSPFVGTWAYVVSMPDGEQTGTFTIVQRGEALGGTFITDVPSPIDPFEPEGDAIAFTFKHPEMGVISIRGTPAGDRFEGEAEVVDQEQVLPFVATRQPAEPTADQ